MNLYSHSRLSCFEQCPFKYKLKYIDKVIPETSQSIEAFMGSMVHETLEKVYKDLKFQKVMTLDDAINYLNELWVKNWNDSIILVRKDYLPEHFKAMAVKFITDYFESYFPFNNEFTIGLEERVIIDLDKEGKYKLQGYIDRLASKGDTYFIIDYKTNSHLKIQDQIDQDRQLALYQIAVQNNYRDARKVILKWHFLAFNKELTSTRSPEQIEALRRETIDLIKRVESCVDFRTNKSALCDWCEFRNQCPEWGHFIKLEQKSVNEFLSDDGVKLVNEFVKLNDAKRDIESRLDKLKDALIAFSKRENVSTVFGSNMKVKVSTYDSIHFPPKGLPERDELIKILKDSSVWEEVIDLNPYELAKRINSGLIPEEVIKRLAKLIRKEEVSRLYPSKLNANEDLTK